MSRLRRPRRAGAAAVIAATLAGCASSGSLSGLPSLGEPVADPAQVEQQRAERTRTQFAAMSSGTITSTGSVATSIPKVLPPTSHAAVRVFYATDRRELTVDPKKIYYGPERNPTTYGQAIVSIPRDHRMGRLERPAVWRLWHTEDADKFVVLLSAGAL